MAKKYTEEEIDQKIFDLGKGHYKRLGKYINMKTKISILHNDCGNKFDMKLENFINGNNRCPICAIKNRPQCKPKTIEQYISEVNTITDGKISFIGDTYINNKTKVLHRCNICNYKFMMRPNDLQQGQHCPNCSGNIRHKTTKFFKREVFNLEKQKYSVLGKYINNDTPLLIRHNECNYEYYVRPNDFLRGKRCPRCARTKKLSRGAQKIKDYLDKNNIPYNMEVSFEDLKYKDLLRFDFQIFLKDGTFILLEYNGKQHYENTFGIQEEFEFQKIRDQLKIDYCDKKGIPLYIIRYDEDIERKLKDILY